MPNRTTSRIARRAVVVMAAISLLATAPGSTLAATTAGTDVLAGEDALSEVSIDVNPTDPDNLVIVGHEPGGFENMNTFFSTDGGATWTERNLGDAADGLASNFRFDPAVVFDSVGNVYAAYGATVGTSTTLVVARSTDGGSTYTNFAQLATTADIPSGPPGNDKWQLATGPGPGGVGRRVYISWTQNIPESGPTDQRVVVSASTDDGLNWSAPVIINDSSNSGTASSQLNTDPTVQADGDLFVSWHDVPGNRVLIDRSTDGGATWAADIQVTTSTAGFKNPIPAQPDRGIFVGPVLDVDLSAANPGRLYMVYVDVGSGGLPNTDILVRTSDNDGATWSGAILVNDDGGTSSQFLPWIDVDPVTGVAMAVWYDTRDDSTNKKSQLYGSVSQSGGAAWQANVQIAAAQSDNSTDNGSRYLGNFLEYIGVTLYDCVGVPVWSDNSANGADYDYMVDRVVESTGLCIRPTTATYTGPTSGDYHDPLTVSGTLVDSRTGDPVVGKTLTIGFGTESCNGTTDSSGSASCTFTPQQVPGPYKATASFAGDSEFAASTSAEVDFTLTKEETQLVNLQPPFAGNGDTVTFSATLTEDDPTPIAGRSVTFTLGTGGGAQTCTDPATDAAGLAECTIVVNQPVGPTTLTADFAGDAFYEPSTASRTVVVFTWTTGGNFVIGDGNSATGTTATFWSSEWSIRNTVSGGPAPTAFKGFANNPPGKTTCGPPQWSTNGGNSAPPASGVPQYTAMLVTSQVTKSGSTIRGTKPSIVIVRVNPGYSPSPGKTSTAEVLGQLCP